MRHIVIHVENWILCPLKTDQCRWWNVVPIRFWIKMQSDLMKSNWSDTLSYLWCQNKVVGDSLSHNRGFITKSSQHNFDGIVSRTKSVNTIRMDIRGHFWVMQDWSMIIVRQSHCWKELWLRSGTKIVFLENQKILDSLLNRDDVFIGHVECRLGSVYKVLKMFQIQRTLSWILSNEVSERTCWTVWRHIWFHSSS